ncbi:PGF-pre-PGF domain-containing protein [Methanolobus sp. WCC1]|uniref:PGF-pre-PGF domain-containing protein n=1 Tax=unclassified Methanolobus TaxID=2629569 RepID=UPI003254F613
MIAKKIITGFALSLLILILCGTNALGSDEITATRSISELSVDAGDTFTVTIYVYFQEEIDAPKIEENLPEGWAISSGNYGNSTYSKDDSLATWLWTKKVDEGEQMSITYYVEVPDTASAGSYSVYGIISGLNSNTGDRITSTTIGDQKIEVLSSSTSTDDSSSSSSSSTSSSSSGGGGGGGTSGEEYENILKKEVESVFINKGSVIKYDFSSDENAIEYVQFTGLKNSGKISTTIEVLNDRSSFADSDTPGLVYQNMNIWVGKVGFATSDNIEDPVIGFSVKKEWMEENGVTSDDIILYRYSDDSWNELDTSVLSEDDTSVHFEAETPGFSPFAIAAPVSNEKTSVSSSAAEDVEELESTVEDIDEESTIPVESTQSSPGFGVLASIAGVIIAGIFATTKGRR